MKQRHISFLLTMKLTITHSLSFKSTHPGLTIATLEIIWSKPFSDHRLLPHKWTGSAFWWQKQSHSLCLNDYRWIRLYIIFLVTRCLGITLIIYFEIPEIFTELLVCTVIKPFAVCFHSVGTVVAFMLFL